MGTTGTISVSKMFKRILQFSLFAALVVAKNSSEESGEEMEKSDGLCMGPEEVAYWCTAGTPLGEKLMGAMMTCSGSEEEEEEMPAGRKKGGKKCKKGKKCKGKGKGKGKKCPTVDEVEAWFMEEHQDELCVFSELGWLDNSGNFSDAAAEADLATLSPNVTAVLSEDNMQQCMEMVMEKMAEDKIVKKCVVNGKGNYSEEEKAKLEELATATAGIQCFLHMFQDSCKEYVGGKVYEALYSSLVPLAG